MRMRGSPPPTRGTHAVWTHSFIPTGITPAYAGNTMANAGLNDPNGDHPRLRGEHVLQYTGDIDEKGSPPPTRGTLKNDTLLTRDTGITPAYAGNTNIWYFDSCQY